MAILAFCPNGHTFESRAFRIEHFRTLKLSGNMESCPTCGAMAPLMEGTFEMVEGVLRVLTMPSTSLDRMRQLKDVLSQLKIDLGSLGEDEARELLVREAPELVEVFQRLPSDPTLRLAYVGLLVMVIQTLIMLWGTIKPTDASFTDAQVEHIIEQVLNSQATAPPPSSAPPPGPPTSPPNPPAAPPPPATGP